MVSEIASVSIANVAAVPGPAEFALRQATTFNTVSDNAHEALVLHVEESAQPRGGGDFLATGVVGCTGALVAVQSVLREDRTVASALVCDVMAQLTNGIGVAVSHVRDAQCRQTTSLDFTVDYPGEAGVVIGTVTISHHEGSLWMQTSGIISGVANEAEICAYGCHHAGQGDHHQEALHRCKKATIEEI